MCRRSPALALSPLTLTLVGSLLLVAAALPASGQGPPCRPCGGVIVDDPGAAADGIGALSDFEERHPLYVAWDVDLGSADVEAELEASRRVRDVQATPWMRLVFTTPPPLVENTEALNGELETAAALARDAAEDTHFQVVWRPSSDEAGAAGTAADSVEAAFLIKRASVALTGARTDATVISGPFPADPGFLRELYGQDVAAYLDGIALEAATLHRIGDRIEAALAAVTELDPGRPVVVDGLPLPAEPSRALARAAELAVRGAALALFAAPPSGPEGFGTGTLAPFVTLATDFRGDLSHDPQLGPDQEGGADGEVTGAWSFVREDLGVRTIVELSTPDPELAPEPAEALEPEPEPLFGPETTLRYPDPTLLSPEAVDPATTEPRTLFGTRRDPEGISVPVPADRAVWLLRLERGQAVDLEQYEERVDVAGERRIPVEEILRRLQAFEDAQARRLDHFSATNTTHLRFGAGAGQGSVEATLEGAFFSRQGPDQEASFDWAWQRFLINGIRWRGEAIPEIPLLQPEKAATLPIEITFTRQYSYRLAGSDTVDGRDCWVVEFRPAVDPEEGRLYRGRVWIDKELFARVRSRAVQLGLEGEVLSNEETLFYTPVDSEGDPVPWPEAPSAYVLPLRLVGQQLLSVVNATTLVERETVLSDVRVNAPDFDERRLAVMASEATMVRDTDKGLRYLVKEEGSDERVVQEGFDTSRLFGVGGVFYDDSLDYPLPLGGLNYLDFDFRGTGNQLNLFFAGALMTVNYADPRLGDSRWDVGGDAFVLAVPTSNSVFRDGDDVPAEEVELRTGNVSLKVGRPLGSFVKLSGEYEASYRGYDRTGDTAPDFRPPSDHVRHTFELSGRVARFGYSLGVSGSYNLRSDWEEWGFPGNPEFSEDHEDYLRWGLSAAKTFHLPRFQKIGVELDYVDGSDLDRFSKYGFGFFGDTRVHGYPTGEVRAEEAALAHLSYGFEIGEVFRIEAVADAALATDPAAGLDEELLAGVGLQGTFMGPWQTVVNLDVGVPVEGPADGFGAYLVFLKLFEWERLERWLDPTEGR